MHKMIFGILSSVVLAAATLSPATAQGVAGSVYFGNTWYQPGYACPPTHQRQVYLQRHYRCVVITTRQPAYVVPGPVVRTVPLVSPGYAGVPQGVQPQKIRKEHPPGTADQYRCDAQGNPANPGTGWCWETAN